jgi:hypothetical protein
VVAHTEVIAFGFDVGVDHLVVEKLRVLWVARNAPVVVVEQPPEKAELAALVQNVDMHEVGELTHERLRALFEARQVTLDLAAQERLHGVVGELRLQLVHGSGRVTEKLSQSCADAGLRP